MLQPSPEGGQVGCTMVGPSRGKGEHTLPAAKETMPTSVLVIVAETNSGRTSGEKASGALFSLGQGYVGDLVLLSHKGIGRYYR